jgi:tRNA (guanine-N7-)-methyltransferase
MHISKHNTDAQHRRIRSFVRREGRLTAGQQKALDDLWPRCGLSADVKLNPTQTFGRSAPLTLEIGFGNGSSLARMAADDPQSDFIGIEVHRPGVGHLLIELDRLALDNVRIFRHDAVEVLDRCIPDACLDRVLLFFPDPWPKRKHHKRRILQPAFVDKIARKLKTGGLLHMATDWEPYAEHMLKVMRSRTNFVNRDPAGSYSERPEYRPVTRFERRGQRLGHGVRDLVYRRV